MFLITMSFVLIHPFGVLAKDSIFSINKYQEENLNFIKDSYDNNQKKDGLLVGGYYLKNIQKKDDDTSNDYQIIVGKYDKNGKMLWKYTYGKTKEDKIDELIYTYDENGMVDGYGIILEKTYDIEDTVDNNLVTTFIKIDLEGKLVWEKDTTINKKEKIKKLLPIFNENKLLDYYMGIGTVTVEDKEKSIIVKYDRELNLICEKELDEENSLYTDIIPIYNEKKVEGFSLLKKKTGDTPSVSIVKVDIDGNSVGTIVENIEKYDSYKLAEAGEGFLLYGITSDVKLKQGESSYYIVNYDLEGKEKWESIGDIPINEDKNINLLMTKKDDEVNKYFLQYINSVDSKLEVIELDIEGLFQKKIKKINADYYNIESFSIDGDTLYFVGQINCPEDDSCDYDSNSLFLISDEDKVIEVKDSDSTNILIVTMIIIVSIIGLVLVKQRKRL